MKSQVTPFLLIPFLVSAFFLLHIVNEYFALLPSQLIAKYAMYYFALTGCILAIARLYFNCNGKTAFWSTILFIIFYFFGSFHDLVKSPGVPAAVSSYTVLLPTILIVLVISAILIKRRKTHLLKVNRYLLFLFSLLTGFEIVMLIVHQFGRDKQRLVRTNSRVLEVLPSISDSLKPDIFYIVFDEYPSSAILKKQLSFDNSPLDSTLESKKFVIAADAVSNYNSTPLSIAAALNMDYFNEDLEGRPSSTRLILQSWASLEESLVPKLLKQNGYEISNFGLCDLSVQPVATTEYFSDYQERVLFEETLFGRVKKDIWWKLHQYLPAGYSSYVASERRRAKSEYLERDKRNIDSVVVALRRTSERPRFVFAHIMLPHAPFYYYRNGKLISDSIDRSYYDPHYFLQQLQYTNSQIRKIVENNGHQLRPKVIIIAGDHGFRVPHSGEARESHFMNLAAFYHSDSTRIYSKISPVNYFRVVLNQSFNTKLPLLKDSSILLQ